MPPLQNPRETRRGRQIHRHWVETSIEWPLRMSARFKRVLNWLFGPEPLERRGHLWPRWIFLRALGAIFFSAFYSLAFQIEGLIGPQGILPAREYLQYLAQHVGWERYWFAPTLLWLGSGSEAMRVLVWTGLVASVLLFLNIWPRGSIFICLVAFLSFVAAARDFADFQSDGMLLEAGFVSLFFAPAGWQPGLGERHAPSRASLFLLQWEWFRIYFESGVAKLASHDPEWRHLTAMYQYYQNSPLPTWIGWYAQQLPHLFQKGCALFTLVAELGLCWVFLLPKRYRIGCFFILTLFQIGIILTANYAFLNYLALFLGFLLLDDSFFKRIYAMRWARRARSRLGQLWARKPLPGAEIPTESQAKSAAAPRPENRVLAWARLLAPGFFLSWIFYATTALLLLMLFPSLPLPAAPITLLEPFRVANRYGLFAVMTRARYEIEFQGSRDGVTWVSYPFRYKPQNTRQPPGIYAPYQPRFEWNLWFASLESWEENPWVVRTQELLLENDASVLELFQSNPFGAERPRFVRAVLWQYWFTNFRERRETGRWWRRKLLGLYAPILERRRNGEIVAYGWPSAPSRAH